MPNWTPEQFMLYENRHLPQSSVAEPPILDEPMAAEAGEAGDTIRVRVSVVSYRRWLLDADNLCPKYFIDCLRYAKIIPDDAPKYIILETRQHQVSKKEHERTEIEVSPL